MLHIVQEEKQHEHKQIVYVNVTYCSRGKAARSQIVYVNVTYCSKEEKQHEYKLFM
jgi:hypothetical protein